MVEVTCRSEEFWGLSGSGLCVESWVLPGSWNKVWSWIKVWLFFYQFMHKRLKFPCTLFVISEKNWGHYQAFGHKGLIYNIVDIRQNKALDTRFSKQLVPRSFEDTLGEKVTKKYRISILIEEKYRKDTYEVNFLRKLISRSIMVIQGQKFRKKANFNHEFSSSTSSEARGQWNHGQPTNSSKARGWRNFCQPITSSGARGLRNLGQPITSNERLEWSWSTSHTERSERRKEFRFETILQWLFRPLLNFTSLL